MYKHSSHVYVNGKTVHLKQQNRRTGIRIVVHIARAAQLKIPVLLIDLGLFAVLDVRFCR